MSSLSHPRQLYRPHPTKLASSHAHIGLCKRWTTAANQNRGPASTDDSGAPGPQDGHITRSRYSNGASGAADPVGQQPDQPPAVVVSGAKAATEQQWQPTGKRSRLQAAQAFIQQYGTGAFLTYITFSNVVSIFMLSSAYILFTKTTGATPLAPGQWPKFLVFYAGAYAMQHIARPLKLAAGLAGASIGAAAVDGVAAILGIGKNAALVVLLAVEAVLLLCCLGGVALYANKLAAAAVAVLQ